MNTEVSKRVEEIALDLTSHISVVDTAGEVAVAERIHAIFSEMDYWKKHPENLKYVPFKNDPLLNRKNVVAILKGEKAPSKKTVILLGHFDTVGIADYGDLKEFAGQPEVLMEKFKSLELPPEVKTDLESGDYLFGRGLFDMKIGDAIIMAIMEDISKNIKEFEGNLIYVAVGNEEGNSGGMLSAVPELARLKKEEGYDYLALLDTDYMTSEYEGDENKYVYVGTVGKLMPTFYIVGKETHVGESFKGLDSNQLAAELTRKINLNPEFCEVADGEVTLPPITLKQRDLKPEYSVQTSKCAYLFFNYATHTSTPDQVLAKMMDAAKECFDNVLRDLNERYEGFCKLAKRPYKPLPFKTKVLSYEELYKLVKAEMGEELDKRIESLTDELLEDRSIDQRDKAMKVVELVHNLWSDKNPVIITYINPPYYPHIFIEGKNEKEKNLLNAVDEAVNTTKSDYKLVYKKFFPYISDLSYGSAPKDPAVIAAFKANMPGFGKLYELPLEDMQELDVPVLDIGAFGKDAHKFTERIEKKYSFTVAPELVYKTVMNLLK